MIARRDISRTRSIGYRVSILLTLALSTPLAGAETLLAEGMREIEEFRLRQLQAVQPDAGIEPFTTDGCSGNQSKSWEIMARAIPAFETEFGERPPWEACCVAHDKLYWQGLVDDGYNRRLAADRELEACVAATGERLAPELSTRYDVPEERVRSTFVTISEWMYKAVRLGGQPCSLQAISQCSKSIHLVRLNLNLEYSLSFTY